MLYKLPKNLSSKENQAYMQRTVRRVVQSNPSFNEQSATAVCIKALRKGYGNHVLAEKIISKELQRV